ncbi:MAG: hypothetical protein JOZ36_04990 [Acidobacteria bacterium]|nr:hypothetical protein [Acidobacteriota bacterium]
MMTSTSVRQNTSVTLYFQYLHQSVAGVLKLFLYLRDRPSLPFFSLQLLNQKQAQAFEASAKQ